MIIILLWCHIIVTTICNMYIGYGLSQCIYEYGFWFTPLEYRTEKSDFITCFLSRYNIIDFKTFIVYNTLLCIFILCLLHRYKMKQQ